MPWLVADSALASVCSSEPVAGSSSFSIGLSNSLRNSATDSDSSVEK